MKSTIHRLIAPLTAIALSLISGSVAAATYYVDSRTGNDLSDGLHPSAVAAPSTMGPWQSLARLLTAPIAPGDVILLHCNSTWHQTLNLPRSGTASAPITVSSYPENCARKPEIGGMQSIPAHAWQSAGGNIHLASLRWNRIANGSFGSNLANWRIWSVNNDAVLSRTTGCTAAAGACATITSGAAGSNGIASSGSFALEGGKKYRVRYALRGNSGNAVKVYLRRDDVPYEAMGYRRDLTTNGSWQQFDDVFTASASLDGARLDIEIAPGKRTVQIADLQVDPVEGINAIRQVLFNGKPLQPAHHPNAGHDRTQPTSVYAHTGGPSDSVVIDGWARSTYLVAGSDLRLPAGASLNAGMNIFIRTSPWTLDERRVTSVSGSRMNFDTRSTYPITDTTTYYLTGALWMLDSPGEWFFDSNASLIYAWTPDGTPPAGRLAVGSLETGVHLPNRSHVIIRNLAVRGAALAFNVRQSSQVTLDNVLIEDIETHGISAERSVNFSVINTTIRRTGNDAIFAYDSTSAQIVGCDIENNSVYVENGSISSLPRSSGAAIMGGRLASIIDNRVSNSGYNGIRAFQNSVIERNVVVDSCQMLNDCGGIYVSGYSTGTEVRNNVVRNVYGNIDGLPSNLRSHGVGIYLDEHGNNIRIIGNSVSGANFGIQVHDGYDNLIQNNTLFGNRNHQLWMQEHKAQLLPTGDIVRNQVIANFLFPLDGNIPLMQESEVAPIDGFGSFSDNRFSALISSAMIGEIWPNGIRSFTVDEWKELKDTSGQTKGDPTASQVRPSGYAATRVTGSNLVPNGALLSGKAGWTSWSQVAPLTSIAVESCALGNCLRVTAGGSSTLLSTPNFSVVEGQTYRVSFDARTSGDGQSIAPVVRRGGPEPLYDKLMATNQSFTGSTEWQRYSFTFKAMKTVTANDPITGELGARIDFEKVAPGNQLWVTNVEIVSREDATATLRTHLIANEGREHDYFDCPEAGTDEADLCSNYVFFSDQTPVTWPLSLIPTETAIVFTQISALLDTDGDGIADFQDRCPGTAPGMTANASGCTLGQQIGR